MSTVVTISTEAMAPAIKDDMRNSFYDGIFSNMFATLTGGVFLTGFALYLGMNEVMIGLLASIPFMVTIFQLPTSYLIRKNGRRKKISYLGTAAARFIWIPVLIVAFLPISSAFMKSMIILSLIFISYIFISVSYVSWLSWMSDLIPDKIRGSFFGTRNMLCGAAGMIVMVVFGKLLDYLKGHFSGGVSFGFGITFMTAVLCGTLGLSFLKKVSEPPLNHCRNHRSFGKDLSLPFKDANFRKFLIYSLVWGFSVNFAGPFFTLYFLRDLHFSYGFVAFLGMTSAFADLVGMRVWGRISDRVRNIPIIKFSSWVAVFLPLAWISVRPDSFVMPILLSIVGSGFWAGINLCTNNLLLRISLQEYKELFLSIYHMDIFKYVKERLLFLYLSLHPIPV